MSDPALVAGWLQAGRIDVLVNNAGVGLGAPVAEVPLDRFRSLLEVNLLGPLQAIQAVVPLMARQVRGSNCRVLCRKAMDWCVCGCVCVCV